MADAEQKTTKPPAGPSVFEVLRPYRKQMALLVLIALAINVLTLSYPKLISYAIDDYIFQQFNVWHTFWTFFGVAVSIFVLTNIQNIVQTMASERVGRDLRTSLSNIISQQTYSAIQRVTPSKLLTNLTSDIDSIKLFVAQAIVSMVASVVSIIGASILLLSINWKLALAVLTILPIIGGTFAFVLSRVRKLFVQTREVIDWLNRVINESILGAALIRVLNSQQPEYQKFEAANMKARGLGLQILKLFSAMIPIIMFVSSMATVIILGLGGHYVITDAMTLGDFAAFNSYLSTLIFPIFVIGFMSNIIAQAGASYGRVKEVLELVPEPETGTRTELINGEITFTDVSLSFGEGNAERPVLKQVSFDIPAATKTAIIGPTAAGKTQLLHLLTGLIKPQSGEILYDNHPVAEYEKISLHKQIGFVFQDSILFNLSVRENIAFNTEVTEEAMAKAIDTAELTQFIDSLPQGLDTIVSERGASLSGGQKQRIMLARALAIEPQVLLLDDFTARVDTKTERSILANVEKNYPGITLVSVTQKVGSVEHYDKIILLMEGEVLATGTHAELMKSSPEYVQIYESQQSTHAYE